jgi:hypothetical protein
VTTATVTLPVPVGAGTRLLGEVIAWACPGVSVKHPDLVRALEDAGLDPGVARELAPRHAFSRACKRLSDQRIIRSVSEDANNIKFQFTQESREGDRSVTQAVADGLAAVVAEHRAAVAQFGADTRDDTLTRAAEKIRTTKFKLAAYAEYLAGEKGRLDRAVADAERELREKVERIAGSPAEPATV